MTSLTDEHYLLQLKSLPINDLQLLLTYAGQSRTGKRQELLEHCYTLIKSSKIIRDKFEELYNKHFDQGDIPTIPYPEDSKNLLNTKQANIDIRFVPFIFNEELCLISPPHVVPPVKQVPNGSQVLVSFYFLLSIQQASGFHKNK
jgi:hypothetical protein